MVNLIISTIVIGGRSYNEDKSGYPAMPTIFSGVEITWGASSCIDNPDPSRALISLWVPKTHEDYIPAIGEVVSIQGSADEDTIVYIFTGRVEHVKLQDDHKADGGYLINVTAADTLAEAARLRLTDTPWPFESALVRLRRIRTLMDKLGIEVEPPDSSEVIAPTTTTDVRARDVDSFSALEAYQRTNMAYGYPTISAAGMLMPARTLGLPSRFSVDESAATTVYTSDNDALTLGKAYKKVNGVVTRTNYASNPSAEIISTNWSALAGTGGVLFGTTGLTRAFVDDSNNATGGWAACAYWLTAPTGGTRGIRYTEAMSGVSGEKLSVAMQASTTVIAGKTVRLSVAFFQGTTQVGSTVNSANTTVQYSEFKRLTLQNITVPGTYNSVRITLEVMDATTYANEQLFADGVVIEKATTVGPFFDKFSVDKSAKATIIEAPEIPHVDASAIVDTTMEIDSSKVVNEVKVEMIRFIGSAGDPGWEQMDSANEQYDQIFTDPEAIAQTTPQTRNIETDWAIRDAYMDDLLADATMLARGKLLLDAQKRATWRVSGPLSLILDEIPAQMGLNWLISEHRRFGWIIAIDNGPSMLPQYLRAHAGRIVFGADQEIEIQVEPIEYSAPLPVTHDTLVSDFIAAAIPLGAFKTITPRDLRGISAGQ